MCRLPGDIPDPEKFEEKLRVVHRPEFRCIREEGKITDYRFPWCVGEDDGDADDDE